MSNLVSKISFKTVCGTPELELVEAKNEKGETTKVLRGIERQYMRIAGVVRSSKLVTTTFGDSIQFEGEFRAVNITTGETYDGGKLFLPEIAQSFVASHLHRLEKTEGFGGLEIAFDIGIKPSATPTGYEYTIKPLIHKQQDDFLAQMLGSLPPLALQSPAQAAKAESKPTTKTKPE